VGCTDFLAHEVDEPAFRKIAELVVVGGFLADDEAPAVVAGVEPYRGGGGGAAAAVEAHASAHFDERSTLRKVCRFLIFDADQCQPLIILEDPDGADGDFIAGFGLPDAAPVPSRPDDQADYEHQRHHGENDKGFFQR
jgi:hypothetical protein